MIVRVASELPAAIAMTGFLLVVGWWLVVLG